jgi:hypothetical protein
MSDIEQLDSSQLRIYAEVARASRNGVCRLPAMMLVRRSGIGSRYMLNKHLMSLQERGLIEQVERSGAPREIKLVEG